MQFNLKQRQEQIGAVADRTYKEFINGKITRKQFDEAMSRYERDQQACEVTKAVTKKARNYAGSADSSDSPFRASQRVKGISSERWSPPSPMDLSTAQWKSLFDSAVNRSAGYTEHVGGAGAHTKAIDGGAGNLGMKATGEGSPGSMLPPILLPQAFSERYEQTGFSVIYRA